MKDWEARPDALMTFRDAEPGEVRTSGDGTQWWFDADRGWQPVVHRPEPQAEAEAG